MHEYYLCLMQLQFRYIFCQVLAVWLCLKPSRSSSLDTPHVYRKRGSVANGDRYSSRLQRDNPKTSSLETVENDSVNELLMEIRDLLKTRSERKEEQLNNSEMEEEIKTDWMLAAAVLNRICAVGFGVIFVVGTLTFILLIVTHYRRV